MPSSLQVTIADDYSDPFDAKNDLKSKAGKGESAGYMEPYEAQRIMTGKQSPWHRDLQLSREADGRCGHRQPPEVKVCTFKVVVGGQCRVESLPQFICSCFTDLRKKLAGHSDSPDTRVPSTVNQDRD